MAPRNKGKGRAAPSPAASELAMARYVDLDQWIEDQRLRVASMRDSERQASWTEFRNRLVRLLLSFVSS